MLVSDRHPERQVEKCKHCLEVIGELGEVFNAQGEDVIRFLFGKIILGQCGG